MLTPRDKFRIPLIFVGIVLAVAGLAVATADKRETGSDYVFRVGAWKDFRLASAVPQEVGPWMIGVGVAALIISYATRDK